MEKLYRKRPVVIAAIQFLGTQASALEIAKWSAARVFYSSPTYKTLEVKTLEGTMTVSISDYVIRGVHGEFYPCKPDIFEATYEAL